MELQLFPTSSGHFTSVLYQPRFSQTAANYADIDNIIDVYRTAGTAITENKQVGSCTLPQTLVYLQPLDHLIIFFLQPRLSDVVEGDNLAVLWQREAQKVSDLGAYALGMTLQAIEKLEEACARTQYSLCSA